MAYEIKAVRPRHHEILRLAFLGMKHRQIADQVGLTKAAVSCILRSPIAQAEMARLRHEAEVKLLDTPVRVREALELDKAAQESIKLNRRIVNDDKVDLKLRAKVAMHFMDNLVFEKKPDETESSYREILRSLRDIERSVAAPKPVTLDATAEVIEEDSSSDEVEEPEFELIKKSPPAPDFTRLNDALKIAS